MITLRRPAPYPGEVAFSEGSLKYFTGEKWVNIPGDPMPDVNVLLNALEWVAQVSACDYEYQNVARAALREWDDLQAEKSPNN